MEARLYIFKDEIMKSVLSMKVFGIVSVLFSIMIFNTVLADMPVGISQNYYSGRDNWQKPDEVVKRMNLKAGDIVVDIGAGSGYFTWRFAEAVRPGGKAVGLEISRSHVGSMIADAERRGLDNYTAVLVESDDPDLDPGSVDVVFLCNAYHHLSNRVDYFKTTSAGLKKEGRVVIVDFYKKQMAIGPPPSHNVAKEVVLKEMDAAGYKLLKDLDFLEYQYYLEFGLK
jgi:ubiquinone/menaquinone biosynthesis C-methylase UbiE